MIGEDNSSQLAIRQMLSSFEIYREAVAAKGKAWHWAKEVILFPEALCPSCNGVMKSTRIWQISEQAQRVLQAAYLAGDRLKKVTRSIHPHINGQSGGYVCMGDANSVTEALFLGLGMGSPYWTPPASWYVEAFGHECSKTTQRNSRNHLTESIRLGEKATEQSGLVVAPAVEEPTYRVRRVRTATPRRTALSSGRQQRLETLRQEQAARRQVAEQGEPLFNGSMAGNTESTGISVDERLTGLHVDRL